MSADTRNTTDDIRARVAQRVKDEAQDTPPVDPARLPDLPDSFVLEASRANRVGDAMVFNALHRGRLVFVKRWGRWLFFNGQHWEEDLIDKAAEDVENVCEAYLRVAANLGKMASELTGDEKSALERKRDQLLKRVDLLRTPGGFDQILECAHKIRGKLAIIGDELDRQPYLMACPNGVIDLRTGEMHAGRPDEYLLNACTTAWQGIDAPRETFEQFLLACHDGDREVVGFLKRALGYGLLGHMREHIFLVFYGDKGRNGKDTLMKAVTNALGETLSGTIPVEMLLSTQPRNSGQPAPDVMALRGMRIAWASEPDKATQFAMGKVKLLTGGGKITARGLQDRLMTTWDPTHLLILLTNDVPTARSDDMAFWARMHVVEWRMRFVDDPQAPDERKADKDLDLKLAAEAPGILAWLVEGCLEYLRDGLNPPESVRAATLSQKDKNDDVGRFLEECCELEHVPEGGFPTVRIAASDLYDAFRVWYRREVSRKRDFSNKRFGEVLTRKGLMKRKSGSNVYLGITLKAEMWEELEAEQDSLKSGKW